MGIIEQKPDMNQPFLDSSPSDWAAKEKTAQEIQDTINSRRLGSAIRDSLQNPRGEASKYILEITGTQLSPEASADDVTLKLREARQIIRQQPELQAKLVEFYTNLR